MSCVAIQGVIPGVDVTVLRVELTPVESGELPTCSKLALLINIR